MEHKNTHVCIDCIGEKHLREWMSTCAQLDECHYCTMNSSGVNVNLLVERIDEALLDCFESESDVGHDFFRPDEPKGKVLVDVIDELISPAFVAGELPKLIAKILIDVSPWLYDSEPNLNENTLFYRVNPQAHWLTASWNITRKQLLFEARYVNPEAIAFLDTVFLPLADDVLKNGGGPVIRTINPNEPLGKFFRARVFQNRDDLVEALGHPERHLGPPPQGAAAAGRMNAKGISVFYGATDEDVALAEVRPPVGSYVLMGRFDVLRPLRLLDLTDLMSLGANHDFSPFDDESIQHWKRCVFLNGFSQTLTKPVMPDHAEREYLITQVVSDYLATNKKLNLDGILFRSTQVSDHRSHRNVILFAKAAKVALSDKRRGRKMKFVSMGVASEGYTEVLSNPTIEAEAGLFEEVHRGGNVGAQTLRLDRASLSIKTITAVKVDCKTVPVQSNDDQSPVNNIDMLTKLMEGTSD